MHESDHSNMLNQRKKSKYATDFSIGYFCGRILNFYILVRKDITHNPSQVANKFHIKANLKLFSKSSQLMKSKEIANSKISKSLKHQKIVVLNQELFRVKNLKDPFPITLKLKVQSKQKL